MVDRFRRNWKTNTLGVLGIGYTFTSLIVTGSPTPDAIALLTNSVGLLFAKDN